MSRLNPATGKTTTRRNIVPSLRAEALQPEVHEPARLDEVNRVYLFWDHPRRVSGQFRLELL